MELARARVAADLAKATQPAHRQMLEAALADLDRSLRREGRPDAPQLSTWARKQRKQSVW